MTLQPFIWHCGFTFETRLLDPTLYHNFFHSFVHENLHPFRSRFQLSRSVDVNMSGINLSIFDWLGRYDWNLSTNYCVLLKCT